MTAASIITVNLNPAVDRVVEVPDFTVGGHLRGRRLGRSPAGKAVNVSRALARLGVSSVAGGFVGAGERGLFEDFLGGTEGDADRAAGARGPEAHPATAQIHCRFVAVERTTRENVTLIDPVARTDTHVREEGFAVTAEDRRRLAASIEAAVAPGTWVVFAGSLPGGMTARDLAELTATVRRGGGKVVFDVAGEVLADLMVAEPGAPVGPAGSAPSSARPWWLVKPNRQELAEAFGRDDAVTQEEVLDLARRLTRHAACVVVTLGRDGAWWLGGADGTGDADGVESIRPAVWRGRLELDEREVVNTVGCGDCMLAGLLAGQARGQSPAQTLAMGLATAAANAGGQGIAEFSPERVEALRRRASVDRVDG